MIVAALESFGSEPSTSCVNLVHRVTSQHEFTDPNTIKVVADANGKALYFSRAPTKPAYFAGKRLVMKSATRLAAGGSRLAKIAIT
jgi:CMP-2-keto-3-deoxyoctulosonic acid synthetase